MTAVMVDINVLIDLLTEDPNWFAWSAQALEQAAKPGVDRPGLIRPSSLL